MCTLQVWETKNIFKISYFSVPLHTVGGEVLLLAAQHTSLRCWSLRRSGKKMVLISVKKGFVFSLMSRFMTKKEWFTCEYFEIQDLM